MAVYIKKNGQIIRLDGNKLGNVVKDWSSTSFNAQDLDSLNLYHFSQPLTNITVTSFGDVDSDVVKEYRITFKPASNFTFAWNDSKNYAWAHGEPVWDTDTTYTLVICEGIDTDYIIYVICG